MRTLNKIVKKDKVQNWKNIQNEDSLLPGLVIHSQKPQKSESIFLQSNEALVWIRNDYNKKTKQQMRQLINRKQQLSILQTQKKDRQKNTSHVRRRMKKLDDIAIGQREGSVSLRIHSINKNPEQQMVSFRGLPVKNSGQRQKNRQHYLLIQALCTEPAASPQHKQKKRLNRIMGKVCSRKQKTQCIDDEHSLFELQPIKYKPKKRIQFNCRKISSKTVAMPNMMENLEPW